MNPLSVILIHSNYTMESKAYCYLFGKCISVIASKGIGIIASKVWCYWKVNWYCYYNLVLYSCHYRLQRLSIFNPQILL